VALLAAKQRTGVAPLGRYITTHVPSMARLLNAARPFLAHLVFSNKKAWWHIYANTSNMLSFLTHIRAQGFFVTVRAGTAYREMKMKNVYYILYVEYCIMI